MNQKAAKAGPVATGTDLRKRDQLGSKIRTKDKHNTVSAQPEETALAAAYACALARKAAQ
jgi:hypothetical protein